MSRRLPRAGEWVEIRSAAEILAKLDADGRLDGLPFMPEMLAFCGQRVQVVKSAHKTCDTIVRPRGLRMRDAVHLLDLRCDGAAHGGCQARCLLFWKTAWLRFAGDPEGPTASRGGGPTTDDLHRAARRPGEPVRYASQATELIRATTPLAWWDPRQYVRDVFSGNVGLGAALITPVFVVLHRLIRTGVGYRALLATFNALARLAGRSPYPFLGGRLGRSSTPEATLDLAPGELVRVRNYEAIRGTLNAVNRNRGLLFSAEMVPYCGRTLRVLQRVEQIIDEATGEMRRLPNACVILDGAVCRSELTSERVFCPRAIYPYWREIWLERVSEPGSGDSGGSESSDGS